jgi:hypothetical protein
MPFNRSASKYLLGHTYSFTRFVNPEKASSPMTVIALRSKYLRKDILGVAHWTRE